MPGEQHQAELELEYTSLQLKIHKLLLPSAPVCTDKCDWIIRFTIMIIRNNHSGSFQTYWPYKLDDVAGTAGEVGGDFPFPSFQNRLRTC